MAEKPCIFCGGFGDKTKQHAFPDRLHKLLPRLKTDHAVERMHRQPGLVSQAVETSKHVRQGHVGTRKPRVACGTCNRGWLRKNEEKAFEALTPLIMGVGGVFPESSLLSVATMAAAMTAVIETDNLRTMAMSQGDRDYIRRNLAPKDEWGVFIGKTHEEVFGQSIGMYHAGNHGTAYTAVGYGKVKGATTTLQMGQVVLQVCDLMIPATVEFEKYAKRHGVHQIWPPRGDLDWASLRSMTAAQVFAFSQDIRERFPAGTLKVEE